MPIKLADDNDDSLLDAAETLHDADPVVRSQIEALLDDPITLKRVAEHHSSLLVRTLAAKLNARPARLRDAVRRAWMSGVDDFRRHYDRELFAELGIADFGDLYPVSNPSKTKT